MEVATMLLGHVEFDGYGTPWRVVYLQFTLIPVAE
jgi:hypothetical protein